jgi:hypothetical protein
VKSSIKRLRSEIDGSAQTVGVLFLGIIIGAIIGVWVVSSYSALIGDSSEPFNSVISSINAGSSVLLAAITAVYVILTGQLLRETKNARRQELMPIMNLDLEQYAIGALGPKLENVGNGPARDVDATVKLVPGGKENTITSKNIRPGDFAASVGPVSPDSHENYNKMVVEGEYTDAFGERECFKDEFDLAILENLDGAESMMDRDRQLREIKKIRKDLGSISDSLNVEGLDRLLSIRTNRPIIEVIRENDGITLQELSQEVGLNPLDLGVILTEFKEYDMVEYDVPTNDISREENRNTEIKLNTDE